MKCISPFSILNSLNHFHIHSYYFYYSLANVLIIFNIDRHIQQAKAIKDKSDSCVISNKIIKFNKEASEQ